MMFNHNLLITGSFYVCNLSYKHWVILNNSGLKNGYNKIIEESKYICDLN